MEGQMPYLDDFIEPGVLNSSSFSPLTRVPVQGFFMNSSDSGFAGPLHLQPSYGLKNAVPVSQAHMGSVNGGFGILSPLEGSYRLDSCHPRESDPRHSALQSIESTLSTIDYPHTPSKLFTEPARVQDGAQFNIQSLDFLSDTPPIVTDHGRSVRLKLATAPAGLPDFPRQASYAAGSDHSSTFPCVPASLAFPSERNPTSGGALEPLKPQPQMMQARGASLGVGCVDTKDLRMGMKEACRGSLQEESSGHNLGLESSISSAAMRMEDWGASEDMAAIDRVPSGGSGTSANPRKTEQNRRAQARFRQRKKDMFFDQKKQILNLTAKLEKAMRENKDFEEKTSRLQQIVQAKEERIEAMRTKGKENPDAEEMINACWNFVVELKRGRRGLVCSRQGIADMVNAMLVWDSPALGFIRKEMVEQLMECLKQDGEKVDTPANLWMNDLISSYEKMMQRCGEAHPQGLRALLGLQLPEQNGRSADEALWRRVLAAGGLRIDQKGQLASARNSLIAKMQQFVGRRRDLACLVQNAGQNLTATQEPLLGNLEQSQRVLELHTQILKEERSAVFNFLTIVRLVLEPVQQARLMVASYPFALDLLAVCSIVADAERYSGMLSGNQQLLSQLPQDSPFQALTPNHIVQPQHTPATPPPG